MFLTKRQKELYDYLQGYIRVHGYAPTFQEIGKHFKLSSLATVHKHLSNLEAKGLIKRHWNYSRAIELLAPKDESRVVALPLLGTVAAGQPIEAIQDNSETVDVPADLVARGEHFALTVVGDSMVDAGIFDGDTAVIRRQDTADTGEIVVALVDDGEVTL